MQRIEEGSPRYMRLQNWINQLKAGMHEASFRYCADIVRKMVQAKREGKPPLEQIPGYKDAMDDDQM
jgi:hypothetical protein